VVAALFPRKNAAEPASPAARRLPDSRTAWAASMRRRRVTTPPPPLTSPPPPPPSPSHPRDPHYPTRPVEV
jgi:hypothetical protein